MLENNAKECSKGGQENKKGPTENKKQNGRCESNRINIKGKDCKTGFKEGKIQLNAITL